MKNIVGIFIMLLGISFSSKAQTLDEELGFVYVKAEYLYETGRFEDAIVQYNQVIAKDPKYKDALIHRGLAKYALAAYNGSKSDALQSIELKGIQSESAALLGRSFGALNNFGPAISCMTAAISLDSKNYKLYEWRAGLYEVDGQMLKACQDYEAAVLNGSQMAEVKARNLCGSRVKPKSDVVVSTPPSQNGNTSSDHQDQNVDPNQGNSTNTTPTDPNQLGENEVLSDGQKSEENNGQPTDSNPVPIDDSEPAVIDENLPKNDNTVNNLTIDDDLSIAISGQELGIRKIKEIPSILILADENGKVTINFCVNKDGVVTTAEFNGSLSTIAKKSLVSLAIRKAKEFEFERGKYDMQCGIMVFNIKGS